LISAHGRLKGLPLHALPLDEETLIARWPVQYVPSLGLPSPAHASTMSTAVLLMGSSLNGFGDLPLKDVESELSDLEQIWKSAQRRVIARLVPADATPADAGWPTQKWSEFAVLHFACHGRAHEGWANWCLVGLPSDAIQPTGRTQSLTG